MDSDVLERLGTCGWPVASLPRAQLRSLVELAGGHGAGSAVVQSCQRIEVFRLHSCECPAPLRLDGLAALRRLAELAAGLHSLVLGETQILGQVRGAVAQSSPDLRHLGAVAIGAARQFRQEQGFAAHTGHLLDRALRMTGLPVEGGLAVAGAGAVGRLVAQRAGQLGFRDITVLGRRPVAWLEPPMRFRDLDALRWLPQVDVLVTCLGADAPPLTADLLPPVRRLIVDLGTPRNIDGDIAVPVVSVRGMMSESDDGPGQPHRAALVSRLHATLDRRLGMGRETRNTAVGRLRFEVERVRQVEVERIQRLHPELPPRTVDAITRSLLKQVFHAPTERLRLAGDDDLGRQLAALFCPDAEAEVVR